MRGAGASARLRVGAAALLLAACARGTDHERLGDRRYAERAWPDALAEYRLAARQHEPSLELRAKLAAAAFHAGDLVGAAADWRELGRSDASARAEAAEGLIRTARAALASRDPAGLRAAVDGLRVLQPARLAELADGILMVLDEARRPGDADLVLAAAAAARGSMADSLVGLWAEATARAGRCDLATHAWEALVRRGASSSLARAGRAGQAGCQVEAGRAALAAGELEKAEAAFHAAIAFGLPDSTVRTAWLLIGDARWAAGDTATAIVSYRKAIAGTDEDNPVAQRAKDQLARLLGNPSTP